MDNEKVFETEFPRQEPEPENAPVDHGGQAVPEQPMPQYQPTSTYRWVNPEVSEKAPQKKPVKTKKVKRPKKHIFRKVMCVLLVILLVAGGSVLGGFAGAKYMEYKMEQEDDNEPARNEPAEKEDNKKAEGSHVTEGEREENSISINKVETDKIMTAAEVYAANVNSTVGITTSITTNYWGYTTTSAASGSGFIYSDDGYILTNYHVVEDSSAISVSFYDGSSMDAELIGYDESNDIAVLKVEAEDLVPVIIGDSDNMNVGDTVLAIGNPLGELTFSLTSGAVSALNREVTFSGGITMNLIQTDCAINSGNSGGALFNLYGEVIGITNAKYSGSSAGGATIDNIGFAIPINHVRPIVDSIIEKGYVVKPYIGVMITDVSQEAQGYGLPAGASIQSIVEDGPAEEAGLKANDIITHINGEEISGSSDLKRYITASEPGDMLEITIWRKGQTMELELEVGEQIQSGIQQTEQTLPQQGSGR